MEPSPAGMEGYLKYPSMPLIQFPFLCDEWLKPSVALACLLLRRSLWVIKKESSFDLVDKSYVSYLIILRGSGARLRGYL